MTVIARTLAAVLLLCFAGGQSRTLQAQQCALTDQGPWWPARYEPASTPTSAADRSIIEATLKAVEGLVRKTSYATPRGFAIRPWWAHTEATDRTKLSKFSIDFVVFLACSKNDEHGADISFTFNPSLQEWSEGGGPSLVDERGDGLFAERPRTESLFGATATYGHFQEQNKEGLFVLFTAGGESPTLPVTREEYLLAVIFTLEGKRKLTATAFGDKLRAEIAAMSPKERASQAFVLGDLVPAGTPNANAFVRANPNFYRARRWPFETRALLVRFPNAHKELLAQQQQLYRQLDWAAVKQLVTGSPGRSYLVTERTIDTGVGYGQCVAVDLSDKTGVWWWEPGSAGCGSRSTGPGLFHPEDGTVVPAAVSGVHEVGFRLGTHSPTRPFVDVRLLVEKNTMRVVGSTEGVRLLKRSNLEIPEMPPK